MNPNRIRKRHYKLWIFTGIALLNTSALLADGTFVGNGGHAADFELSVIKKLIFRTAEVIQEAAESSDQDEDTLCRCSDQFAKNQVCDLLDTLNEKQIELCSKTLKKEASALARLASDTSNIQYDWQTGSELWAMSSNGSRKAQAVANNNEKKIIISEEAFLDLTVTERTALLSHEFFHLIPIDGKYLNDDDPIAEFGRARDFLNVLGAAVAVAANELEVTKEMRGLIKVSRSYKKYFVGLGSRNNQHSSPNKRKMMTADHSLSSYLSFIYKPIDWGIKLTFESYENSRKPLDLFEVSEEVGFTELGVLYGFNPLSSRLSRWSELVVLTGLDFIIGRSTYKISDSYIEIEDTSFIYGGQWTLTAMLPLINGFWIDLGGGLRHIKKNYDSLQLKENETSLFATFGGSYGF